MEASDLNINGNGTIWRPDVAGPACGGKIKVE